MSFSQASKQTWKLVGRTTLGAPARPQCWEGDLFLSSPAGYEVDSLSAEFISQCMLAREKTSLNKLAEDSTFGLLQKARAPEAGPRLSPAIGTLPTFFLPCS